MRDKRVAVFFVQVNDELAVAARSESMTARLELCAKRRVVVELAAHDARDGAVFVFDRLRAACDVDDRETRVCERNATTVVETRRRTIGSAVCERSHRVIDLRARDRSARRRNASDDAAHVSAPRQSMRSQKNFFSFTRARCSECRLESLERKTSPTRSSTFTRPLESHAIASSNAP